MRRFAFPLLLILLWTGCDSTSPADDRVISGVDLDVLFAAPTDVERTAIANEWLDRDTAGRNAALEYEEAISLPGDVPAHVRVYSHTVGGLEHFGAIIVPDGAEEGTLPALMYLHGGDNGVSVDGEVLFILEFFADVASRFAIVIPSFRDESVRIGSRVFRSEGPPSPWDYDVDDAMAFLGVALRETPEIDFEQVGAIGMSRGGGVAMLMGIRDRRLTRVVSFFGPTDFFGPFVQDVTEEALRGMPRDLPGLDYLNATFIEPLGSGVLSIGEARAELLRRSAVQYADRIPNLQVHHGTADTVVPVSQAESMIAKMESLGLSPPRFEAFLYEGGTHNPLTMDPSLQRASTFLSELLSF